MHQHKVEQSVDAIVSNMQHTLSYIYVKRIKSDKATPKERERAKVKYREQIIDYEKKLEKEIEFIWNHRSVEKVDNLIVFEDIGLFSKESASIFGLSENEIMITGASAGAMSGLGIDSIFGGNTLFLASIIGGVVGGIGARVGFDNLYEVKILGQHLGKRELTVGPMKNLNFPYILLGRSLYHASVIAKRSHALRESVELEDEEFFTEQIINTETRKKLEKLHITLRKGEEPNDELLAEYRKIILQCFLRLLR